MPAQYSGLFDSVLVIAGLVLITIGLVMFVRSKSSGVASSVEAFGIKLNVTHPSLILVLAGVGLMLAPRLLPGLPGQLDTSPPTHPTIAADAPTPLAVPPADTTPTDPIPSPPPQPSARSKPTSSTPPASTAHPVTSRPARSTPPSGSARAPSPAPARSSTATPAKSVPEPVIARAPEPSPSPAGAAPSPRAAAPTPDPAAAKPARPMVAYAALGLPINRDFWSGETQTSYTRRMHTSLQQAGQTVLRLPMRNLNLDQAEFNRWWNESRDQPVSREYCAAASAPLALVSARIETPFTSSRVESAYWPEFSLRLYHCATHRVYRQHKSLSPVNTDEWAFSTELNGEIERFLRTYRSDLAD